MPDPANPLILLLPERRRFAGQAMSPAIAKRLAQARRLPEAAPGEREQLLRYFDLQPRGWPMAAISRQADAGDAMAHAWLRADPVYLRPDMNGARLMAWGNLGLTTAEAEAFLAPLRPVFGDAGVPISAPSPERWYLTVPRDASLPTFSTPAEGLGEDLLSHLPEGPDGRHWRVLLNEAQVMLHNNVRNDQRIAAGLLPVNSLWFWGGGVLPESVTCEAGCVLSEDVELLGLARLAGAATTPAETGSVLLDLRVERDWAALQHDQIAPALDRLPQRHAALVLDFADGFRVRITASQRWQFWRRPLSGLES